MVQFVKSVKAAALASSVVLPKDLNVKSADSVRNVASSVAYGMMDLYTGNETNTPDTIAIFPDPYYWWEAGAAWGAMLDYSHYTGDSSYDGVVTEALLSQVGPNFDYMMPRYQGQLGNDDQAFWSFAVMSAAERNFPQPDAATPSWVQMGSNIWNTMVQRWNTTHCGGGLTWQIYPDNPNGLDYKNSVSNGGFFQLSARLARATNNDTYLEWAEKTWDWTTSINMIDNKYNVYDGTDSKTDCTEINKVSFSYSQGIYLYGAAVLANHTEKPEWKKRALGLLDATQSYFSPYKNATDVMFEHACETVGSCNTDMKSFKGYLSRFMWASTLLVPEMTDRVTKVLRTSATAAGKACSGGHGGTTCGQLWYTGGFDGVTGLGQQMSALETIQGLLAFAATPPFRAEEIRTVRGKDSAGSGSQAASDTSVVARATNSQTAVAVPTKRDNAAGRAGVDLCLLLGVLASLLVWAVT